MSRQQFRMLIVLNIVLAIGTIFVDRLTENMIPPELRSYFDFSASVLDDEQGETFFFNDGLRTVYLGLDFITVVAATGLVLVRHGEERFSFFVSSPPFY